MGGGLDMTITKPVYATREMVKRALDIKDTARANVQVDRLLETSSRSIDGMMHRVFYPRFGTIALNANDDRWLNDRELISVTSLTLGGVAFTDYVLEPRSGPPYSRIAFSGGLPVTGELTVVGLLGYTRDLQSIGSLLVGMDTAAQSLSLANGSVVGVGDLLVIGSEYLLVTGRGWVDSGQNLQGDLTASAAATGIVVTNGGAFFTGEVILLDTEQCMIVDIVYNTLMLKRTWDGTVLAAHSNSDVYASRSLTVTRGAVGSPITTHVAGEVVNRWVPPLFITSLCIAETSNAMQQEQSAYARVVGSEGSSFEARGVGLKDIRDKALTAHGRKSRMRSV